MAFLLVPFVVVPLGLAGQDLPAANPSTEVVVPNVVHFAFDRSDIDESSAAVLDSIAAVMSANANVTVAVHGHTDVRGSDSYNQALSGRRANAVIDYMASQGITQSRMRSVSHGERDIYRRAADEREHALNRRVEFFFSSAGGTPIRARRQERDLKPLSRPDTVHPPRPPNPSESAPPLNTRPMEALDVTPDTTVLVTSQNDTVTSEAPPLVAEVESTPPRPVPQDQMTRGQLLLWLGVTALLPLFLIGKRLLQARARRILASERSYDLRKPVWPVGHRAPVPEHHPPETRRLDPRPLGAETQSRGAPLSETEILRLDPPPLGVKTPSREAPLSEILSLPGPSRAEAKPRPPAGPPAAADTTVLPPESGNASPERDQQGSNDHKVVPVIPSLLAGAIFLGWRAFHRGDWD